jgi:solute carrier family 25 phosphate transporter 3
VTFCAGYVAGFASSVISHPADSLISLMSTPAHKGKTLLEIAKEVGWFKLWTQGLLPRTLLTGTAVGFQWWIYDSFKTAMGMGTTGGEAKHH